MSDTEAKQACHVLEARSFARCVCEVGEGHQLLDSDGEDGALISNWQSPGGRWEELGPPRRWVGEGKIGPRRALITVTTMD